MFCISLSVHPSVRASETVCFYCFRDISCIYWSIVARLLSLVYLGTQMNWLGFFGGCQCHIIASGVSSTQRCRRIQISIVASWSKSLRATDNVFEGNTRPAGCVFDFETPDIIDHNAILYGRLYAQYTPPTPTRLNGYNLRWGGRF